MTASAGAWYRVGTVNVTNGQQSIVGVNTNWQNDVISIAVGDIFTLDAKTWYEVTAVNSDSSLTLDREFEGATQSAVNYAIVRNTSGTLLTRIAGQIAVQFNQKQLFLDELRTWLNSDNAAEELTDSHGVKTQLKTPAQMVRDHAEKLAELDAIHPHPWAMRKVEFEAMRAANNEKFAASGFVHFGRYNESTLAGGIFPVDAAKGGLFTRTTTSNPTPNSLILGCDRNIGSSKGTSNTNFANVNIAGNITELYASTDISDSYGIRIKLPPTEDGTRTYDSATGVSVTHATPAIAFASETETNKVVTNRFDMWGFEAGLREINDDDPYVYKNGLIQSVASDINGVPTEDNNDRPFAYFAWYEGDTSTRGKGVNWQTASEAERIAIQNDRGNANRIYFDDATGKFYQWSLHGRSFAGLGNGDWNSIDAGSNVNELKFESISYSRINAQGVTNDDTAYAVDGVFIPKGNNNNFLVDFNNDPAIYYLRATTANQAKAVDGECYFLVCGTVERLNQGIAHPKNPLGSKLCQNIDTASLGQGSPWDVTDNKPLTKAECFGEKVCQASGTLEYPYSGRSDGRLCDVIYASGQGGVCRDMRYSAWGLTSEDFAEQDLKIKSGEYRGRELLTSPLKRNVEAPPSSTSLYFDRLEIKPDVYTSLLAVETVFVKVVANAGATFRAGYENFDNGDWYEMEPVNVSGSVVLRKKNGAVQIVDTGNSRDLTVDILIVGDKAGYLPQGLEIPVASEYTHKEVVGEPPKILLCEDLKDGWIGSFNGFIPDGVKQWSEVTLSKLTFDTLTTRSRTDDNGATWSTSSFIIDPIKNTLDSTGTPPLGRVEILSYKTKAKSTIPVGNTDVYGGRKGIGEVFAGKNHNPSRGIYLGYSLTGGIFTASNHIINQHLALTSMTFKDGRIDDGAEYAPTHTPISLGSPNNNSQGFKALNYNVAVNQQGFINYAYAQLAYDATAGDWGDDGKIHIVDNQTTMLDENGNTVLVGTARCVEPLGWIKNDK